MRNKTSINILLSNLIGILAGFYIAIDYIFCFAFGISVTSIVMQSF